MKKLFCLLGILLLVLVTNNVSAQDTIHLHENGKIICKVIRITETEVEYKKTNNPEGPLYSIRKYHLVKIVFSNGTVEEIDGPQSNSARKLINLRNAVKIDLFSPLFNKITVGFEHCHKFGWNSEIYLSYLSDPLLNRQAGSYYDGNARGIGLKYGSKFYFATDSRIRGSNFVHPLKGIFIRADFSYNQFSILNAYKSTYDQGSYSTLYTYGSINVSNFAVGVSTGAQLPIGRSLLVQFNVGLGYYTGYSSFKESFSGNYYLRDHYYVNYNENRITYNNLTNFLPLGIRNMYLSANFCLGYVIGKKSEKYKVAQPELEFEGRIKR